MPIALSSAADKAPAIARYERAVRAAQALVLVLTVLLGAFAPASPSHYQPPRSRTDTLV
jgi:hypothetical protein